MINGNQTFINLTGFPHGILVRMLDRRSRLSVQTHGSVLRHWEFQALVVILLYDTPASHTTVIPYIVDSKMNPCFSKSIEKGFSLII